MNKKELLKLEYENSRSLAMGFSALMFLIFFGIYSNKEAIFNNTHWILRVILLISLIAGFFKSVSFLRNMKRDYLNYKDHLKNLIKNG